MIIVMCSPIDYYDFLACVAQESRDAAIEAILLPRILT